MSSSVLDRQSLAASPEVAGVDFVVYGTVPWDRPWLTEHNLAHALARNHRVLFVEPPVSPLTPLRYGLRRDSLLEARRLLRRPVRRDGRLHVLRLLALPPLEHPRARRASAPLLRAQVSRAVARLGMRAPVVLACRSVIDLLGAAGERACLYLAKDLLEAGGALIGKDGRAMAEEERRMCAHADIVCAVTRRLQETFAARGVETELVAHGFHAELAPLYDGDERPPEYEQLGRPLLGYAGRIDGRLDFEVIGALADRFPGGSIVLVGPVSPRLPRAELDLLAERANVHLLGPRPREALPAYLRHLDCSILPYREDEWLRHGSPLKLWDALYAGPPVVGSGCVALADHQLVRYASPPTLLPDVVAAALREGDVGREARRAHALRNSWDRRAAELEELLATRLHIQ
jgi:teichuronic acid biosynthesis glycosyltransferase TuaH